MGEQIVGGRTESDPNMGGGLEWLAGLTPPAPVSEAEAQPEEEATPPEEAAPEPTTP